MNIDTHVFLHSPHTKGPHMKTKHRENRKHGKVTLEKKHYTVKFTTYDKPTEHRKTHKMGTTHNIGKPPSCNG